MEFAAATDVGKVRKVNEDSYYIPDNGDDGIRTMFFALADGMGGHNAGEIASSLSIRSVVNYISRPNLSERILEAPAAVLQSAVKDANEKVMLLGGLSDKCTNMGTTMIAVLCVNDQWNICHVGDSRAYLISDESIKQITKDHSLVEQLVDEGAMVRNSPEYIMQRHILTRALGVGRGEAGDLYLIEPKAGDMLLLCSDGLSELATDEEILSACTVLKEPQIICDTLVKLALNRGGIDNVTVCLCKYTESEVHADGR